MTFRHVLSALLLSTTMAVQLLPLSAAEQQPATMKTKTQSVAVFKNGLGFFVREGEARLDNGWATSDVMPPAALGTFWVGSSKPGITVERLVATEEEITKDIPAASVQDILELNKDKRGRFMVDLRPIEGTLLSANGDLVLIQTSVGTMAINKRSIQSAEFEGTVAAARTQKQKEKLLRFRVVGAKDTAPVTLAYLRKEISWSPAYLIEIMDDKKARITMQGLLINDAEDIDGADVHFVVGYPNFVLSDQISPLLGSQSVSDFVTQISRPLNDMSRRYSGIAVQSLAGNMVPGYAGAPGPQGPYGGYGPAGTAEPSFGYSAATDMYGGTEEDLFLYKVSAVSLKKGERAYYTVFSAEVPYEHVYEWKIPDTSNIMPAGYVSSSQPDRSQEVYQIWHKLRMHNTSKFPWTTAPAMAMSDGQPLSQDVLQYASRNARADLTMTVATDISGKRVETEKSRENNALNIYGNTFAKVTAEGKLTLKNYKASPVNIEVQKTVVGEILSAGSDGAISKSMSAVNSVNPTSVVKWNLRLDPGEEKTLEYTYSTYVRY